MLVETGRVFEDPFSEQREEYSLKKLPLINDNDLLNRKTFGYSGRIRLLELDMDQTEVTESEASPVYEAVTPEMVAIVAAKTVQDSVRQPLASINYAATGLKQYFSDKGIVLDERAQKYLDMIIKGVKETSKDAYALEVAIEDGIKVGKAPLDHKYQSAGSNDTKGDLFDLKEVARSHHFDALYDTNSTNTKTNKAA